MEYNIKITAPTTQAGWNELNQSASKAIVKNLIIDSIKDGSFPKILEEAIKRREGKK